MDKKELRVIFMGTPDFAVEALDALIKAEYNIVAVVTNIDKASGRGMKLQSPAVKKYAIDHSIDVLQPKNLKAEAFIERLKSYQADIQVVVAFRMLPEVVWDMPALGTINIHASLLPDYRGAAPINWAIINGEKESGISTFQLKHAIDTGDILLQERVTIDPNDTAGNLHDKLAIKGGEVIVKTLDSLLENNLKATPQQFTKADKNAPKIFKDDCAIDWNKDGEQIHNFIRGLSPYPCAYFRHKDKNIKVYSASFEPDTSVRTIGEVISQTDYIRVSCTNGYIYIHELQVPGKKRVKTLDFLRGNNL